MTKLRTIAAAAVIAAAMAATQAHATEVPGYGESSPAAVAPQTRATEVSAYAESSPAVAAPQARGTEGSGAGEWNTRYGMIFSVQNVFGNNSASVIGDFGGGVGLQYTLAPQRAVRLSIDVSRRSNPGYETETTTISGGTSTTTTTYNRPSGFTSAYALDVAGEYLMRLAPAAISPYLGVGASVGYAQSALKFEDDINNPNQVFNRDDMSRTFALGAVGTLGLEWRMHRSVSLFAEYGLNFGLVSYESSTTDASTFDRTLNLTTGTKSEGSRTRFFNFDTAIGQGGQLGLVAFF
jgi:opacity protein-like surface antigen